MPLFSAVFTSTTRMVARSRGAGELREVRSLAVIGIFVALVLGLHRPIGSELRYVAAAQEMVRGGDWIVPHLSFVPYLEKPILIYWVMAASYMFLGASNLASHLPSVLTAWAMILLTYRLGAELSGRATGCRAGWILGGCGLFLGLESLSLTDNLLALFVVLAMFLSHRHFNARRGSERWLLWMV